MSILINGKPKINLNINVMKKTLFFLLITGVIGSLQAQKNAPSKTGHTTVSPLKLAEMRAKARQNENKGVPQQSNNAKRPNKVANAPQLPFLGSSANTFGVLDATTTAVTANEACNLIVMTHRENSSNTAVCGTGAYIAAYSTDNGAIWDTTVTLFCHYDPLAGTRYPNGVIFNPYGNTNPTNAYDIVSGPYTNGNANGDSWVETVYGSTTFGDANTHGVYWTNGNPGVLTQNNGDLSFMSSSDDSTFHVIGEGFKLDGNGNFSAWTGAVLTTGKFNGANNADTVKWTQTLFRPHIVPDYAGFNNSLARYDDSAAPLAVPGTAWSQDGKTGYVVIFANLDSTGFNFFSDQPIVYKTTNSGQTWNMMTPENFATIPSLTSHLEASQDGTKTPLWLTFETGSTVSQGAVNSYDLTVDYQGNLHIFGVVVSSYFSNADSSHTVSFYSNQDGYIYDVYTTTGGWNARLIDSMQTMPCANANRGNLNSDWDSTGPAGFVGMGNRLQASRTTDGKHIFCTWEDDVTGELPNQLIFPDVFGQGYDVATGKASSVHQFTTTSDNYFLCVSDIALTSVNNKDTTYTIPCTITYPQQTPNDGSEATNYYYLGNVVYDDTLGSVSAVPTVATQGFYISPNYPNPFSNTTRFNIGLNSENLVSIDVFNLFGQKVYSTPAQQMSSGNHLMTINASGWSPGVYFYRVTVGNQTKTQKMVVQ